MPHQDDILFQDFTCEQDEYQPPSFLNELKRQDSDEPHAQNLQFEDFNFSSTKRKETPQIFNFNKTIYLQDYETEAEFELKNVEIQFQKYEHEQTIAFSSILSAIESKLNFSLKNFMLFVQDPKSSMYIFVNNQQSQKIDFKAFKFLHTIKLRVKSKKNEIEQIEQQQENPQLQNDTSVQFTHKSSTNELVKNYCEQNKQQITNNEKRVRERSIQEVIDKIKQWRDLFKNGIQDPTDQNQYRRLTLAQAAEIVGLPKKSLDNYYLQIKRGQKLGFDFYRYQDAKIGVLRQFNNKKQKEAKKNNNNIQEEQEENLPVLSKQNSSQFSEESGFSSVQQQQQEFNFELEQQSQQQNQEQEDIFQNLNNQNLQQENEGEFLLNNEQQLQQQNQGLFMNSDDMSIFCPNEYQQQFEEFQL